MYTKNLNQYDTCEYRCCMTHRDYPKFLWICADDFFYSETGYRNVILESLYTCTGVNWIILLGFMGILYAPHLFCENGTLLGHLR